MTNPVQVFRSLENFGPFHHRIRIVEMDHELVPMLETKPSSFLQKIIERFYKPKPLRRAYVEEKVCEYFERHKEDLQSKDIDIRRLQTRLTNIDSRNRLEPLFQDAIRTIQQKQAEEEATIRRQMQAEEEARIRRQMLERREYEQRCDVVIHCKDGDLRVTQEELEKFKTFADFLETIKENITKISLVDFPKAVVSKYFEYMRWLRDEEHVLRREQIIAWFSQRPLTELLDVSALADFLQDTGTVNTCDDYLAKRLGRVAEPAQLNQFIAILDNAYQGLRISRTLFARQILSARPAWADEQIYTACRDILAGRS